MHTRKQRKAVATWVASKQVYERKHGPAKPKRRKSWPIPVAYSNEPNRKAGEFWRCGGTVAAKGKDGSGQSKWHRRIVVGRSAERVAA